MKTTTREIILQANAIFLLVAATGGMMTDLAGAFLGAGPQAAVLGNAPHSAIGFVEAHGLALIFGFLLWQAPSSRFWHLTAATIHVLLGTSNLVFWPIFVAADMLTAGYITTSAHWMFVALQLLAAIAVRASQQSKRWPQKPKLIVQMRR